MKRVFLISLTLFFLLPGWSQDPVGLMREASMAEAAMQEEQAFRLYKQVLALKPDHVTALCKSSELACKIGKRQVAKEKMAGYYEEAIGYAKQALKVNPASADANFVMAMALGRKAQIASGGDLVQSVKDIKKHAERAIQLNPADFRAYHVLGKWNFEVTDLGSFKRAAVKVFYGAFPEASFKESARNYETSMQLNPSFNLNYLELAKVYHKLGQKEKAITMLRRLALMPLRMEDDARIRTEGHQLLQSLQ